MTEYSHGYQNEETKNKQWVGLVLMALAVIVAFAYWNWIGAIFLRVFGIAIFIFGKD